MMYDGGTRRKDASATRSRSIDRSHTIVHTRLFTHDRSHTIVHTRLFTHDRSHTIVHTRLFTHELKTGKCRTQLFMHLQRRTQTNKTDVASTLHRCCTNVAPMLHRVARMLHRIIKFIISSVIATIGGALTLEVP